MQTCSISVAIPTYNRPQDLLNALAKIQSCDPSPAEIIVHIDGGDEQTETVLANQGIADIVILKSDRRVGPGGGRNRAIALAKHDIVASFDDDSYPIDPDYFTRLLQLFERYPNAAVIGAAIYHRNESIAPDQATAAWEHTFVGCGCAYRKAIFLATQGYVELPLAYGMEEVDLSLRLHDRGWGVLISPWLRVFHDTLLEHHQNPKITAASLSNQALLTYLRYPPHLWWIGLGQCASRMLWLFKHGRRQGIVRGVVNIPTAIQTYGSQRQVVTSKTLKSFLALRRQSQAAALMPPNNSWICCQLGAREHYAVPRALHQANQLTALITDAWVSPGSQLNRLPGKPARSLGDRYHPDLATAPLTAFTSALMGFELQQRWQRTSAWPRMMARNAWFQQQTIKALERISLPPEQSPTLFTYSYAALELLRYARGRGWPTVLGQIDPGRLEEKIVFEEYQRYPHLAPHWQPVPPGYWEIWQQECALADRIVVNSAWSKQLLEQTGVEPTKIEIVPLVYEPPAEAARFVRTYPPAFTPERPLRVLFLGLITLRKGIAACLEAVEKLLGEPVEFWFVGPIEIEVPSHLRNQAQIHWVGPVPRSQTQDYYRQADVFLFPTLSDGFGLTQLEAQAWQLPIIASKFCGEVVTPGVNGLVLETVSGDAIAQAIRELLQRSEGLTSLILSSSNQAGLAQLGQQLQALNRSQL